jgi:hypothetical protein
MKIEYDQKADAMYIRLMAGTVAFCSAPARPSPIISPGAKAHPASHAGISAGAAHRRSISSESL